MASAFSIFRNPGTTCELPDTKPKLSKPAGEMQKILEIGNLMDARRAGVTEKLDVMLCGSLLQPFSLSLG